MIIIFLFYFIILYPEECYTDGNVTNNDDDDQDFPYSEDYFDKDDVIPRRNNEIWVPRVVNGVPAKLGDIPYQVSLKKRKKDGFYRSFCGASIIGEKKILTAAHCFLGKEKIDTLLLTGTTGTIDKSLLRDFYAVAGNLLNVGSYSVDGENGQWRKLASVKYSKRYERPRHDIAIAYLDDPFIYNNYVGPIPIATKDQDYNGLCLVSGYGRRDRNQLNSSEILLVARMMIMTQYDCSVLYDYSMEMFICTAIQIFDIGRGDSGGPLVCTNTSDPNEGNIGILVGIIRSHSPNRSSLFVRVSKYYHFITGESRPIFGYPNKYRMFHSSCIAYKAEFYELSLLFLITQMSYYYL